MNHIPKYRSSGVDLFFNFFFTAAHHTKSQQYQHILSRTETKNKHASKMQSPLLEPVLTTNIPGTI